MATRRQPPPRPERPHHSISEKQHDIKMIERRIAELEAFDPNTVTARYSDPKVNALHTSIAKTLADVFGNDTDEYRLYQSAANLDRGPLFLSMEGYGRHNEVAEARKYVTEGRQASLDLLRGAVRALAEEIERAQALSEHNAGPIKETYAKVVPMSRRVFIVHGRDGEMLQAVARFLTEIHFEPIILHEQPNGGRTVIEKFEAHSEPAGFAVVLLSPDDEGCLKGDAAPVSRARQNVILELGYFAGRLGRSRVCALQRGDIEVPSDIVGVVFEPFDEGGGWKMILARELEAAEYDIDWNFMKRHR